MHKSHKNTENFLSYLSRTLQTHSPCPIFINKSQIGSPCKMSFVSLSLFPGCTQMHYRVCNSYVGLPKRDHFLTKSRLKRAAYSASHLTLQNLKLSPPQLLFKESDSPNKSVLWQQRNNLLLLLPRADT